LAGPSAGMFFAELGARVIKIEPLNGDVTRSWKLVSEDSNKRDSAYYNSINYAKESIFLDLKEEKDIMKIHALLKEADVFTANFKPGSALKYKLDYQSLSALNPELIYAQLYGFNASSARLAYDVVMQAETGFLSMTGNNKEELCKMPVALIDLIAGHHIKESVLLALLKRERFGKGSHIVHSLLHSGLSSLANQASSYLNLGVVAKPMGTLHPNIAPYGEICKTADGEQLILAIGSDQQFIRLLHVLDLEEVLDTYSTNQLRLGNRLSLYDLLKQAILNHDFESLHHQFTKLAIPFGHVKNVQQAMELAEMEGLILENQQNKSKTITSLPFKFK